MCGVADVFVKKWTRNKHAIMFQLNNKIVQVVFEDKTEAVLSSKSHMVTYVDKKGVVCSHPLSNVLDAPSPELAKRLRYTKDLQNHIVRVSVSESVHESMCVFLALPTCQQSHRVGRSHLLQKRLRDSETQQRMKGLEEARYRGTIHTTTHKTLRPTTSISAH